MRCLLIFLAFFFFAGISNAQYTGEEIVIPRNQSHSTKAIADYINGHQQKPADKARSIYAWVTTHIRYDTDSSYLINLGPDPGTKITAALRRRKGVCENFTAIFHDIARQCGLQSHIVNGYSKQGGRIDRTSHSWIAIELDAEWYLCDPTWDAGAGNRFRYWLAWPQDFIQSHMPFDPLWQLLEHPVSHKQFYEGNTSPGTATTFNYKDSILADGRLTELEQLRASLARMQAAGQPNELVKNNLAYTRMLIEIIHEDKDMELYNSAVNDLNTVYGILNNFIHYRNNQFMPAKARDEMKAMLDIIHSPVALINKKLDAIDHSPAGLTIDTGLLRHKLSLVLNRIKEQQDFLEKYWNTPVEERTTLFYQ